MILYDCEIKNPIEPDKSKRGSIFKFADSWTDYAGMGVSCICTYDYNKNAYGVYLEDNFDEFIDLIGKNVIVGYNNYNFDDNLIESVFNVKIEKANTHDILNKIWKSAGLGPKYNRGTHSGYSLDDVVRKNFKEEGKPIDGSKVPFLWQAGQIGKVINYCLNDVKMLKMVVDVILRKEMLINPKTGQGFLVEW